jgi:hypothetical protein
MPYTLGLDLDAEPAASIGLMANGFPDSVAFLDAVEVALVAQHPNLRIHRYNKGNASISASDALMDEIANQCDGLIAAYGH